MFTSRAEYRILLRQDNADMRLTPYAEKFGLASEERSRRFHTKKENIDGIIRYCQTYSIKPSTINTLLEELGTAPLQRGCKLFDLINRPQLSLQILANHLSDFKERLSMISSDTEETIEAAEIEMKYHGYIARERAMAEKCNDLKTSRYAVISIIIA